MSLNGIAAMGNPAWYGTRKAKSSTESTASGFMEIAAKMAAQDKIIDYDEKAFDMVGPNAPLDVKNAWMEAAKEVNANGLGIKSNGQMTHISEMMVQRCIKTMGGETENLDILGNSVESAIQATKQALFNLEHPAVYTSTSLAVQRECAKEREFYIAFLEKLNQL